MPSNLLKLLHKLLKDPSLLERRRGLIPFGQSYLGHIGERTKLNNQQLPAPQ